MEQEVVIGNNYLFIRINDHNNDLLFHLVGLFVLKQCKGARSLFLRRPRSSGIIPYIMLPVRAIED